MAARRPEAAAGWTRAGAIRGGAAGSDSLYFGKPVVAFRIGGIPEVAGEGARLHDFGDFAAMGASLDELVESPDLRAQLGERGRARVTAHFNASEIVPRYESVYQRVLQIPSRA